MAFTSGDRGKASNMMLQQKRQWSMLNASDVTLRAMGFSKAVYNISSDRWNIASGY